MRKSVPFHKISTQNPSVPGTPRLVSTKYSSAKSGHWLWFWVAMTGIAMLSATAGALLAVSLSSTPLMQSRLSPEEEAVFGRGDRISKTSLRLSELTRPVNILVLGVKVLSSDVDDPDARSEDLGYHALVNSFEGLSDTMLLLRFDPEAQKLAVLSIPRDTRTKVEGLGVTKINAANARGGPALSAKATSDLLNGVPIDRYIRINVQGVEKLVDALGGVTVYVPKDMKYQDDSQHLYINLKAGRHHLDGDQALQLLRFRYDEYGDIGRIQRQQMVMRALMEQALNPATLARVPQIMSVIQTHIDTNLTVEELMALVGFGVQTERSDVEMLLVPGTFSTPDQYIASYWLPDRERIAMMMAKHFNVPTDSTFSDLNPTKLRIAIQDSTGSDRAIQSLANFLQTSGYRRVYVATPWNEPLDVTRIVAQQGDIDNARAIRNALGVGEIRVESTGNLRSDVTIQLGQDWLRIAEY
ncbi:LytR family transcriptional regulator [Gloeocapsopsis sp. AAB1 = 1H9]|uniref:LytR family transcriptional regulator n=1 Tax=Gloeocapsopsis dulcis AAB1 = 1H9 TaxID=1433147 RepID=A0A6N8FQK2_9CHRO|nr:LytR family transcriptional regulator [Gloeocapsopsis dulcis AAB1 = 1H9]